MSALPIGQKRWSPVEAISAWWQYWTGFNPAYSDLSCCAQDDVDRIARDLGVSGAELRKLASLGPDAADQLLRRMEALDLNPAAVAGTEPPTFQDLQRVCSLCDSHKRCAQDLASNPAGSVWEDYCPNAATLKVLKAMPWPAQGKR